MRIGFFVCLFLYTLTPCFAQAPASSNLVLAPVLCPEHFGFTDQTGNVVIPAVYEGLLPFADSLQQWTAAKDHNKWGFINRKGEWIISPRFDELQNFSGSLAIAGMHDSTGDTFEGLVDHGNMTYGLINQKGEWKIKPTYRKLVLNDNGVAIFKNREGFWGLMNTDEQVLTPAEYAIIFPFQHGMAIVVKKEKGELERFYEDFDLQVTTGGKWGMINEKGKVVLPVEYDYISMMVEGMAAFNTGGRWVPEHLYSSSYRFRDGKWGFIDSLGHIAISPQFDKADDFHSGVAYVTKSDTTFYMDKKGRHIPGPPAQTIDLASKPPQDKLISFCQSAQWGYIDTLGNTIIPAGFGEAQHFSEGLAAVMKSKPCSPSPDINYKDLAQRLRITFEKTSEEYIKKMSDAQTDTIPESWGYINAAGKQVISFRFLKAGRFSDGLAAVDQKGLWGFIDKTGEWVIKPQYDDDTQEHYEFKDGLAMVRLHGRWGFINKTGKQVIPAVYNMAREFREGLAAVKIGERWGFIEKSGKLAIHPDFEKVGDFYGGMAFARKTPDENTSASETHYGFIDTKGNWVIPPRFAVAEDFSDGLAAVVEERLADENTRRYSAYGRKWGYIDRNGTLVIPCLYSLACPFEKGIAFVKIFDEAKYINRSGDVLINHVNADYGQEAPDKKYIYGLSIEVAKGGRCGFKNKKRKWAIQPIYNQVTYFSKVY